MIQTTLGQLLIDEALPEDMRGRGLSLDKKNIQTLFQEIAEKHPDQYRDIAHRLMRVGADASDAAGGYSFGLKDIQPSQTIQRLRPKIEAEILAVNRNPGLSREEKKAEIVRIASHYQPIIQKQTMEESVQEGNVLAKQINSGAKGSTGNLSSIRSGDMLYMDHNDNPIAMPILHGYAEGLTPAEYWAGTYGARKGIVDLQMATRNAGAFSKQLTRAAHRLIVTEEDSDKPHDPDAKIGYPSHPGDPDNEGSLLAADAGPYKRNTVLTPRILNDMKHRGIEDILVRSPVVGGPKDGGVYSKDVGIREKGILAPIGDYVGIAAAQAIGEPTTQAAICLAEGTLVRMADWSVRPIELVKPGEFVMGSDLGGRNINSTLVIAVHSNGLRHCVETKFNKGNQVYIYLQSTKEHKILAEAHGGLATTTEEVGSEEGKYAILAGGMLVNRVGQSAIGQLPTYDLEINHPDHLFLLANGLIVSNSSKHLGGVAGASKSISGFSLINQLIQVPKTFPGGGVHAELAGKVSSIEKAPQGGHYLSIGNTAHYIRPELTINAKPNQVVEAGDLLTDGLSNPAEVVRHKGIGEGKRQFINQFMQAAQDSGFRLHRRNVELMARGLIDHVRLDEEMGDYVPDDVISYNTLSHFWKPRNGYRELTPRQSVGKYLEAPVLHHTIGTMITPSLLPELEKYNVKKLTVHEQPPPFEPVMIRGESNLSADPDWLTRMLGSNLEKHLLRGAHRGEVSDMLGTSFVPGLAEGLHFGQRGKTKGYDVNVLKPATQGVLANR